MKKLLSLLSLLIGLPAFAGQQPVLQNLFTTNTDAHALAVLATLFQNGSNTFVSSFGQAYFISTNATGILINPATYKTTGVLDGSTRANFDFNMGHMPSNCVVYLGAGTFQTAGRDGWFPHIGMHIIGAGRDVTTLQFPTSLLQTWSGDTLVHVMIEPDLPYRANSLDIEHLTCDANYYQGFSGTLEGIHFWGPNNHINDVRFTGGCSVTNIYTECFGIFGFGFDPYYSVNNCGGNVIENCLVDNYHSNFHDGVNGNDLFAIGLSLNSTGIIQNNIITNNYDPNGTNTIYAIGISQRGSVLNNQVYGCFYGMYEDTGNGFTNVTVLNNKFVDVGRVMELKASGATYRQINFSDNVVILTNCYPRFAFSCVMNIFAGTDPQFSSIIANRNYVTTDSTTSEANYYFTVTGNGRVSGLVMRDNFIQNTVSNSIVNCTNITVKSFDLLGNPWLYNTPDPLTTNTVQLANGTFTSTNFVVGTLYTNGPARSRLEGTAILEAGANAIVNLTLNYTNGTIAGLPKMMQAGGTTAITNWIPFSIPLAAGGTFKFTLTGTTGALTNMVLWSN